MKLKSLIFAGILIGAAPVTALVAQNWNATISHTAEGYRVGNPDAAVKLIEFISYSCPHCANYTRQSEAAMQAGYILEGRVEVEVRAFIRNPIDLAAALVAQCGPENRFFANHRALLFRQDEWLKKAQDATPAQTQRWSTGTIGSRMRAIAGDLDFYELMEPRGYSITELDQCLNDEAKARAIVNNSAAAISAFNLQGTPSFAINGRLLDGVYSWQALQPALDSARTGEALAH